MRNRRRGRKGGEGGKGVEETGGEKSGEKRSAGQGRRRNNKMITSQEPGKCLLISCPCFSI